MKILAGVGIFLTLFVGTAVMHQASANPSPPSMPITCKCGALATVTVPTNCPCQTWIESVHSVFGQDCDDDCHPITNCTALISLNYTGTCAGSATATFQCNTGCGTRCTSQQPCPVSGGDPATMTMGCSVCTQV